MAIRSKRLRLGFAASGILSALAILILAETGALERESAWLLAILPVALIVLALLAGRAPGIPSLPPRSATC